MKKQLLECEGFSCLAAHGEVTYDDDGLILEISGTFHEGDRKSGFPILCDKCGSEAAVEDVVED